MNNVGYTQWEARITQVEQKTYIRSTADIVNTTIINTIYVVDENGIDSYFNVPASFPAKSDNIILAIFRKNKNVAVINLNYGSYYVYGNTSLIYMTLSFVPFVILKLIHMGMPELLSNLIVISIALVFFVLSVLAINKSYEYIKTRLYVMNLVKMMRTNT